MCNLAIRELHIYNYRRFEQADFVLNEHMNVFAGKNGSGKTAVLEAANVILGAYLAAFKTYVPSRFVFNISRDDAHMKLRKTDDSSIMYAGGIPQFPCKISCSLAWDKKEDTISFQRVLLKLDGRTKFEGSNPMQSVVVDWETKMKQAKDLDKDVVLPIVLYLSSARLWNENKNKGVDSTELNRTHGYQRCLDGKHGTDLAFGYIKALQAIAVEECEGKALPAYEAILDAVNYAMSEELNSGEKVIFSTRYSKDMVALKTKEGTIVPFSSLSDGYRNVIKIVIDIASRMCMLNPYLKGEALQQTPGVVIIDELDLSLHPTWQRRIVGILKHLFPKVQFLCATHSPFIIQSLEGGELITLCDDGAKQPDGEDFSGESIEDIAEDIMEVVLPQYSEKRVKMYQAALEYFDALNRAETEEELKQLYEEMMRLEAEYSDNPAYLATIRLKHKQRELEVKSNASHS